MAVNPMTLREKILLSLSATAAVGGGLYYAFGAFNPSGSAPQVNKKDYTALIAGVRVNLDQGKLTGREERVLAAATTRWLNNPLRERPLLTQITEKEPPLPTYSGFIDIGSHPIAIIDGRDYRAGETIKGGEFQLSEVFPDHVEVLRHGATDPINIPLEQVQPTGEPQ